MDDASRWKLLECIKDRKCETFQRAIQQWTRFFGFPNRLVFAQETGVCSEEIAVWLEGNLSKLDLLPTGHGGSTGAHTAAATIESNMRALRRIAHR